MKIKIRKQDPEGLTKFESYGPVKEVLINEGMLNNGQESVSVCYRGRYSSGIIEFTPEEIEKIYGVIQKRIHLVKGFKKLMGKGAILIK